MNGLRVWIDGVDMTDQVVVKTLTVSSGTASPNFILELPNTVSPSSDVRYMYTTTTGGTATGYWPIPKSLPAGDQAVLDDFIIDQIVREHLGLE